MKYFVAIVVAVGQYCFLGPSTKTLFTYLWQHRGETNDPIVQGSSH